MKTRLYALLVSLFLLMGCATKPYTPPVMRKIAPEISYIADQAKTTTNSAERTLKFAETVDNKFKGDKDAHNTVVSARETVIESKRTEAKLADAQAKAEKLDKDAEELEGKYNDAAKRVDKLQKENQTLTEKIKELTKKIWSRNFTIVGLSVLLVAAVAFVIKPWKWFI